MALLNSGVQVLGNPSKKFVDPKANILFGGGNQNIKSSDISDFLNKNPNMSAKEIEGAALAYGVNQNQIADAMKGNTSFINNMNKYVDENISKELLQQDIPKAAMPAKVQPRTISVGNNETVEGRMNGLLKDPNNPLNVQAQTFANQQTNKRGLLNSSINTSAAQDAMMKNALPIAQQDAATFYDATKTNVGNDMSSQMFNSDMQGRIGMFNAGTQKDYGLTQMNNQNQFDIAKMDSDNKLAVANIQAMANDSGIAGDLGKTLMGMYQQTAADPNLSPDAKASIYNNLKTQYESIVSLLPSIKAKASALNFPAASGASGTSGSATAGTQGAASGAGTTGTTGGAITPEQVTQKISKIGSLGFRTNSEDIGYAMAWSNRTGVEVDPEMVVPDTFVYMLGLPTRISTAQQNPFPLSPVQIAKKLGYTGPIDQNQDYYKFLANMVTTIHPPGTKRADNPSFYVWNPEALMNIK